MTVSAALGWTGAVLLIPAIVCWIAFAFMEPTTDSARRARFLLLGLAIVFTDLILAFWIAALWSAVAS